MKSYNFSKTKITSCRINRKTVDKLNYKPILVELLRKCNKILDTAKYMNFVKEKRNDRGYVFYDALGVSIQGADANDTIREIMNQCIVNKMHIEIIINMNDKEICISS